jgi:hypothetical protein
MQRLDVIRFGVAFLHGGQPVITRDDRMVRDGDLERDAVSSCRTESGAVHGVGGHAKPGADDEEAGGDSLERYGREQCERRGELEHIPR